MMEEDMLNVAVIGAGNIGRTHCTVYAGDPLAKLVAVCDIVREKADAFAERFGARAYYSVPDLLRNERLDLVSVTTAGPENGGHHYEPVMQALEAGVHVLCEKPLSNEIAKAREMVRTARAKNLYLGVNLNHRFVPLAERAKRFVTEGALGELCFINMALWIANRNDSAPYFHLRALHPHSIDVMRYFCGDIVRVQAFFKRASHRQIWSNASINMQFANGMVGHLTGSYDMTTRHPFERCEVAGTKGRFVLENVYERLTFYPHDSDETIVLSNPIMGGVASFQDTFKNRIHRFLEQVSARVPREQIEGSGEEALAAQEVIEAAIRSFETGAVVEVPAVS
ncbi:MAG TPA: Gfo/Idh/MocA family oxidoreductase [Isosphaeraceae bacterium]|nr:Gfo/Idh/MocA family oxidoreductase [Isosphaeraceae bacterium]